MFKQTYKKYGNKKTTFNGLKFDSKFEAGVAADLELKKKAGLILDYDCQYRVDIEIYNSAGRHVHTVSHKVDFRQHNLDGSFTLIEAKGFETADYLFRRKLLEKIWLIDHPDHDYHVIKQAKSAPRMSMWKK